MTALKKKKKLQKKNKKTNDAIKDKEEKIESKFFFLQKNQEMKKIY